MIYRFDDFELDDERFELRQQGTPIELQRKVHDVLAYLLANPDRVASKAELLEAVWAEATVSEASLTRCISLLRKALGDTEGDGRILVTVRGRGYRLGVPVLPVSDEVSEDPPPPQQDLPKPARPSFGKGRIALVGLLGVGALLVWLARPYADLGPSFESQPPSELSETSVAVLPFLYDGATEEQRHLAGSLALEVAIRLRKIPNLEVTPPGDSLQLGLDAERDPQRVGRSLGCGRLVSGRLQFAGDKVRVAVELIDSATGFVLWSDVYPEDRSALGALQERIGREVVSAVAKTAPVGVADLVEPASVEPDRYRVEGRLAVLAGTHEGLLRAVANYERATEVDPTDVRSLVAKAVAYHGLWDLEGEGPGWLERGRTAATVAVELAPDSVDAHVADASIRRARRDWDGSLRAYQRAIELGGSAEAYEGLANLYSILGRPADALRPATKAVELAALHPSPHRTLGRVWFFLGQESRAISQFQRSLDLRPESALIMGTLATAFERNGEPDKAAESITQALPPWMQPLSRIHNRIAGDDASLRLTMGIDRLASGNRCGHNALEAAMVWARIGNREWLYECLEEASERYLWFIASEPIYDPYRGDEEFQRIVQAAGFPLGSRGK